MPFVPHPAQKRLRRRRQANQKTFFPEQSKILFIHDGATAGCDYLLVLEQNLRQRHLLGSPKISLSFPAEDFFNFHSLSPLDYFVEIHEMAPELARQISTDGAFSNRHETREGDIGVF